MWIKHFYQNKQTDATKNILLLLFFQCGVVDSFSQNVAIENLRQNIAYPYIYNPMNIIVEEIPCDEIFVSTNNGEIKSKGNCKYVFIPHEVGIASVFIHKMEKGDTLQIKERKYRVKPFPLPTAMIGNTSSGKIELEFFKAHNGISAPVLGFDISGKFPIKSFRMRIIKKDGSILEIDNRGERYEQAAKKIIRNISRGDKVLFDKIKVKMPGMKGEVEIEDLFLEIE